MATVESENKARYRQLLDAAQSRQSVWIAESEDGALLLTDEAEDTLILVWPDAGLAADVLSRRPDLSGYKPVRRTLSRWLKTSTPNLVADGIFVAANPDAALRCLKVPANDFARDLSSTPHLQGADISRIKRKVRNRLPK